MNSSGVYVLYGENDECLYVGMSLNMEARLDQHRTAIEFRRSETFLFNPCELREREREMIQRLRPKLNKAHNGRGYERAEKETHFLKRGSDGRLLGPIMRSWRHGEDKEIETMASEIGIEADQLSRVERGEPCDSDTLASIIIWMIGREKR